MKPRDTSNPHNRFHSQTTDYDDGEAPPASAVTLIDDHSRSILSENDSPDVGFRWSVNPYRGCQHACSYCAAGDTRILLADARTRQLADLKVGDEILGTRFDGKYRRLVRTTVLAHWKTLRIAYRVQLADGTDLVASGDHRFLSNRGWKHVKPYENAGQRPFLTPNNHLLGVGPVVSGPEHCADYRRGYLSGMIRGDGMLFQRRYGAKTTHQFRLALIDDEGLARAKEYLASFGVETRSFEFSNGHDRYAPVNAIRTSSKQAFEKIVELIAAPVEASIQWDKGFLAGIFDAEGSRGQHVFRISNTDEEIIDAICSAMRRFEFDCVVESKRFTVRKPLFNVRLRRGLREHLRFFHLTGPAITRKWNIEGTALKQYRADTRVVSIERVGLRQLFDITTGTGDFIANGVVSHNCYARPSHEYLDLGAGTDFDTKIVVKRQAPDLLRAAFDKPSWKGELVMFSGVTDCYQPVERELGLTRKLLEVCAAYRNPCSVISKAALVERDIDLFLELAGNARFGMSVSLAFCDNDLARAIEPWAPSPDRRFKVIEHLAKAGVPVGVMCAPIIPGINDSQMVTVLERAAAAGATWAGWVLLRLPGAVKEVFEERVRVALPLAADKVLHRIRETRGGEKLYDARFGVRGRGEGPYADTIKMMFDTTVLRLGLNRREEAEALADDAPTTFRRPEKVSNQLKLF